MHAGWQLYMDAFWDLASERSQGSRIRWTAIDQWCRRYGLSFSAYQAVKFVVYRLDLAYIDWAQTKAKAESKRREKRNAT